MPPAAASGPEAVISNVVGDSQNGAVSCHSGLATRRSDPRHSVADLNSAVPSWPRPLQKRSFTTQGDGGYAPCPRSSGASRFPKPSDFGKSISD